MTKAENYLFVFENPEHDYPKRIVYKVIGSDSLHAFIDDGKGRSEKETGFLLQTPINEIQLIKILRDTGQKSGGAMAAVLQDT